MFAIRHKDMMAMVPVVQAGVLAVYGIIIGYMLCRKLDYTDDKVYSISTIDGYKYLCAGKSEFVLFCCMLGCVQYEDSIIRILHLNLVCLYVTTFSCRMY